MTMVSADKTRVDFVSFLASQKVFNYCTSINLFIIRKLDLQI